jgi:NADH-quinone oxidoreductase subunit J
MRFVMNDATSDETEFAGVRRLLPGYSLVVSENGARTQQYWDVDVSRVLRLKDAREYDAAFLEVFTASLKAQTRGCGRVGISLSGGLDSSSVACLAEGLRQRSELHCELRGYSMIFTGEPYDEREFVAAVQVIVYAGAIMVLFVFVIMLLNAGEEERSKGSKVAVILGVPAMLAGFIMAVWTLTRNNPANTPVGVGAMYGPAKSIANELFKPFLLPFEITSILILIAIMGAVVLARREEQ